ncbi:NAD(P)/FAD-dependent oxidoreductase [Streptomyces sp. NPDC088387]|uniref:NAD(P)/FAD-dependent oxidoreductase n=1 Tax=Streptomyces sp. NPDC088387 TaxID=3365859 RepID=UPI0037F885CF
MTPAPAPGGPVPVRTLVLVGHGMVGHRLLKTVLAGDTAGAWRIVVLAEEARPGYDRLALSSYLTGRTAEELALSRGGLLDDPRVDLRLSTPVAAIDRAGRAVTTADGIRVPYDALVLATGSRPFVPPVPGHDLPGCFTYRTLDDLDAVRAAAVPGRPGVVVGGGLLGLEAAGALRALGMRPHVVELAPRLLPLQTDEGAGRLLGGLVGGLGVDVHCAAATSGVVTGSDGRVRAVLLDDGTTLETDLVIFSVGVRPRDELAAPAGLAVGPRGGILVDERCRTADPRIWAVGECAAVRGRCYGLVGPGYRMAEAVAGRLLGRVTEPFPADPDLSTRLKLLGVDLASFGDVHATTEGAVSLTHEDHTRRTYARLVLASDTRTLLGGVLAGDASAYPVLHGLIGRQLPASPERLLSGTEAH